MRGKALFILLLAAVVLSACGYSDSDVLASYKDGKKVVNVTRGDFYKTLNRWTRSRTLAGRTQQERALRNFIFRKLLTKEAKALGLDKTDDFKKALKKKVDARLALSTYLREKQPQFIKRKGRDFEVQPFSFKAWVVRHLVIRVNKMKSIRVPDPNKARKMAAARKTIKDPKKLAKRLQALAKAKISKRVNLTPAELATADAKALARVKKAQAELKSGKSFAAVARIFGQDGTARRGGYFGFVYPHQRRIDIPFREAALKLKSGQTSGIVKGGFGYHLIKCDKILTLNQDNIKKYYPTAAEKAQGEKRIAMMKKRLDKLKGKRRDQYEKRIATMEKRMVSGYKQKMGRTLGGFWFSQVMQYLNGLKKTDSNVKIYHEALKGNNPKAVIFEIKHSGYDFSLTLGEYLEKLKKVPPYRLAQYGIKRGAKDKRPFTYEERLKYFNWHITFSLLTYSAYKSGVVNGEKFKKAVAGMAEGLLAAKMREHVAKGLKVTPKEMQAEYKKFKTRYVKRKRVRVGKKWKTETTQLSFLQAKDRVEKTILNRKKRTAVNGLKSRLFIKYAIKVYPDRFEIVKPKPRKRRPRRRMRTRRRIRRKMMPKKK